MASRRFPDNGTRYATRANGDQAKNGVIVYFLDPAGQNRATVYAERGTDTPAPGDVLVNSQTHLDAFGGQVDFRGPDGGNGVWGPDELYASVDGGPIFRVAAAPEPRLRTLEDQLAAALARLAALENAQAGGLGLFLDIDPNIIGADSTVDGITFDGNTVIADTDSLAEATAYGNVLFVTV